MNDKWIVIGVSGHTNSGKTTLCEKLQEHFPNMVTVGQDQFFREPDDPAHVWVDVSLGKRHQNWELPSAIRWHLYEAKVKEVLSEIPTSLPGILLIEGHVIYNHRPFKSFFDKRFFLQLPEAECRERRSKRNYVPADIPGYFDKIVWPMAVKNQTDFEAFHRDGEITYLDGTGNREEICQFVINKIERLVQDRKK